MINQAAQVLNKYSEQLRLKAYQDSANVWTVGWGHTSDNYFKVDKDTVIDKLTAEDLWRRDIIEAEGILKKEMPNWRNLNENQYGALVDFVFNRGTLKLKSGGNSTIYVYLINNSFAAAADELLAWVHDIKGNKLLGLQRRREAERKLFLNPVPMDKKDFGELVEILLNTEPLWLEEVK